LRPLKLLSQLSQLLFLKLDGLFPLLDVDSSYFGIGIRMFKLLLECFEFVRLLFERRRESGLFFIDFDVLRQSDILLLKLKSQFSDRDVSD
jgi:hypothetical protein